MSGDCAELLGKHALANFDAIAGKIEFNSNVQVHVERLGGGQSGGVLDAPYANFFDVSGGCMMDFMAASCGLAMGALNSDAGVMTDPYDSPEFWWNQKLADNRLGGWMKFQAKADGYAGYIPVGAIYLGDRYWALQCSSEQKPNKPNPQNPAQPGINEPGVRQNIANRLTDPCKQYITNLLNEAARQNKKNPVVSTNLLDIFDAVQKQGGFHRLQVGTHKNPSYSYAIGTIPGKNATVYLAPL